jgi:hypothetical protein
MREEGDSVSAGTKLHLHYKNFHTDTLAITEAVMVEKPWKLEDFNTKQALFEQWVDKTAKVYDVPVPEVMVYEDSPLLQESFCMYDGDQGRIYLRKHSLVSLFMMFRVHMLICLDTREGVQYTEERHRDIHQDAAAWACSLFYQLRPFLFRRSVREGKIKLIHPRDLLANPEEWEATPEGRLDRDFNEIIQGLQMEGISGDLSTDEDEDGDEDTEEE